MIDIPYRFTGTVEYQPYFEIVRRIKRLNHSKVGKDESGNYDMYIVEEGSRRNPTIFILSSLHGTEWHPTQYGLSFFEMLRDNTFPDKQFREDLLHNYHLVFFPVGNPWGIDNNNNIYQQFNNPARYNISGVDLNRDFYEFSEAESRVIANQIEAFQPFSFLDMHMFQPDYDDNNLIVANSSAETEYIRDIFVDAIKKYSSETITVWRNPTNPDPESGLARRFASRQDNPYTPVTLAFITEQVRPAIKNGGMVKKLSEEEIYSNGIAEIYTFIKVSKTYLLEHWQPTDDTVDIDSNPTTRLVVRDKDMRRIGALENAFHVSTERRRNEVWYASFSLPIDDPKNALCSHMNYVEITSPSGRNFGLYRIMPTQTKRNSNEEYIRYKCEHVFATLLDDVISGYVEYANKSTRMVLRDLLDKQSIHRWQIGDVDFTRYFTYSFENENGLLAPILEIPKSFGEDYEFTYDTTVYPWRLNLVRPSEDVRSEIRWGKDMIDFSEVSDPSKIVNYIVPKGAGEGVNQLSIERVNGGRDYLKDDASIAKWGKQTYIWVDRRYTDEESLKEGAQALLDKYKEPQISTEVNAVDLSVKPEYAHERRFLGTLTRIIVEDAEYITRINGEIIDDLGEREWDADYEIGENVDDISEAQAKIERSIEVNERYAQGATNIMTFGYQDNADSDIPATIPFYIDDDVVNVNTIELTFRTRRFRAYSQATKGGGAIVKSTGGGGGTVKSTSSGGGTTRSTTSGGGTTATSSSGGGTSTSTQSGGGSSQTSAAGGDHRHLMFSRVGNLGPFDLNTYEAASGGLIQLEASSANLSTAGSSGNHTHSVSIPSHSHNFSTPNHSHSVNIPNHSHEVSIPAHTHDIDLPDHTHGIELPDHTHEVEHKIVELANTPSQVVIKVDGNIIPHTSTSGDRINLAEYLSKDSSGKVTRGRHVVEITPNSLARIEADLIMRVFIQSHLGSSM